MQKEKERKNQMGRGGRGHCHQGADEEKWPCLDFSSRRETGVQFALPRRFILDALGRGTKIIMRFLGRFPSAGRSRRPSVAAPGSSSLPMPEHMRCEAGRRTRWQVANFIFHACSFASLCPALVLSLSLAAHGVSGGGQQRGEHGQNACELGGIVRVGGGC